MDIGKVCEECGEVARRCGSLRVCGGRRPGDEEEEEDGERGPTGEAHYGCY